MTIGKMLELVGGKAGVLQGRQGDATAFAGDRFTDISRVLVSHGFNYSGKDTITSGSLLLAAAAAAISSSCAQE